MSSQFKVVPKVKIITVHLAVPIDDNDLWHESLSGMRDGVWSGVMEWAVASETPSRIVSVERAAEIFDCEEAQFCAPINPDPLSAVQAG